jgi:hypothetical protein
MHFRANSIVFECKIAFKTILKHANSKYHPVTFPPQ